MKKNIMLRLIVLLLVVGFTSKAKAQSIQWNEPYKKEEFKYKYASYLGENKECYFFLAPSSEKGYYWKGMDFVAVFKKDFSVKYRCFVKHTRKEGFDKMEEVQINDDVASFFYYKKGAFYCTKIDAKKGVQLQELEKIMDFSSSIITSSTQKTTGAIQFLESGRIRVKISYYLGNVNYLSSVVKTMNLYFLLDESYQILAERKEEAEVTPTVGQPFIGKDNAKKIDGDGNEYIIEISNNELYLTMYDASRNYKKWKEKIDLSSLDLKQGSQLIDFQLSFNDNKELLGQAIYQEKFEYKKQKSLVFRKLMEEEQEDYSPKGHIWFKLDPKTKYVYNLVKQDYSERVCQLFQSKYMERFDYFEWKEQIINTKDSGQIIITELLCGEGSVIMSYEDLLIYKIDKDGNLLWEQVIPKKQSKSSYSSYVVKLTEGKIIILFNDNIKNKGKSLFVDREKYNGFGPFINSYVVDVSSGQIIGGNLLDPLEGLIKLYAYYSSRFSPETEILLVDGASKEGARIGKVILE